jgi:two-component system NtrC family sensor kinase
VRGSLVQETEPTSPPESSRHQGDNDTGIPSPNEPLQHLDDFEQIARVGWWTLDAADLRGRASPYVFHLLHLPGDQVFSADSLTSRCDPANQDLLHQAIAAAIQDAIPWDLEVPISDTEERWLRIIGRAEGAPGAVTQLHGIVQDVSERKIFEGALINLSNDLENRVVERTAALHERESELHALISALPDIIVRMSGDGSMIALHTPPHESLLLPIHPDDRAIVDLGPLDLGLQLIHAAEAVLNNGQTQAFTYRMRQRLGDQLIRNGMLSREQISAALRYQQALIASSQRVRLGEAIARLGLLDIDVINTQMRNWRQESVELVYEIRVVANGADEVLVIARDVTDRARAEEQLEQSVHRATARSELVQDLDQSLGDFEGTLLLIAERIGTLFNGACLLWLLSEDGNELEPRAAVHPDPTLKTRMDAVLTGPYLPADEGLLGQVIQSGQPILVADLPIAPSSQSRPALAGLALPDIVVTGIILAPLISSGRPIGVLQVASTDQDYSFTKADLHFCIELADRATLALANARMVRELTLLNKDLLRSRDLLRTIFDGITDGLVLLDYNGQVLAVNQSMGRLCNVRPAMAIGKHWQVCTPIATDAIGKTFSDGQSHAERVRYLDPSGQTRMLDIATLPIYSDTGAISGAIVHTVDVTSRLQLETRVLENERFAASGRLAATVAHEINTPLQAIQALFFLIEDSNAEQRKSYLELAGQEIERIARITRNLQTLSHPTEDVPDRHDLNTLCERVLLLVDQLLERQRVRVERHLARDLPRIHGYADQLTQVVINLLINAAQAMPDGGLIRLETAYDTERYPDGAVRISIQDQGIGIDPKELERIFEPFFTTKAEGNGLGLAVCAQIVDEHSGQIDVESKPGAGSTFNVFLPINPPLRDQEPNAARGHE